MNLSRLAKTWLLSSKAKTQFLSLQIFKNKLFSRQLVAQLHRLKKVLRKVLAVHLLLQLTPIVDWQQVLWPKPLLRDITLT